LSVVSPACLKLGHRYGGMRIARDALLPSAMPGSEGLSHIQGTWEVGVRRTMGSRSKRHAPDPETQGLSDEQREVLEAAVAGRSIFFTGPAGTGKTHLLRAIASTLTAMHGGEHVYVTASTGMAACALSGTTLHYFCGMGLAREPVKQLVHKLKSQRAAHNRWTSARVLIVDEISMISGDLFEKIEAVARRIRKTSRPFGGIQVVLCGDFFQLPPVFGEENQTSRLCFETGAWGRTLRRCYTLQTRFRQTDPELVDLLDRIRMGQMTEEARRRLRSRLSYPTRPAAAAGEDEDTSSVILCTHRRDAEVENMTRLQRLPGEIRVFTASDWAINQWVQSALRSGCIAPYQLMLRPGAPVILLANVNVEEGLCNGARGTVDSFEEEDGRVRPVVRFLGECTGHPVALETHTWTIESGGRTIARRTQLPLTLGWAITVHKVRHRPLPAPTLVWPVQPPRETPRVRV
jgi:ATP-dependent DNA helicase PIF1